MEENQTVVVYGFQFDNALVYFNPTQGTSTGNFPGGYPYPGGSVYSWLYNYTYGPYDTSKAEIGFDKSLVMTDAQKAAVEYLADVLDEFRNWAVDPNFTAKTFGNDSLELRWQI